MIKYNVDEAGEREKEIRRVENQAMYQGFKEML